MVRILPIANLWILLFETTTLAIFEVQKLPIFENLFANLHTYAIHVFKIEMVEIYSLTLVNKWRKSLPQAKIFQFWLKFYKNRNKTKNQPKS